MNSLKTGVALFALLAAAGSAGAEPITLRVSHYIPANAMPSPEWEKWLRSMEAASNGELKIEIYPAAQLGKPADQYDLARDGVADLAWSVPGFNPGRFPIFSISELPVLVSNTPIGVRVFDDWYAQYAGREMGDVHYCLGHLSPLSTLNFTSKQVRGPEELKGLRVRPQNATSGRFLAGLGANLVQVAASEAQQAFERGLLDGIAFPWRTMFPFGLEKYAKFHMDFSLMTAPSAWVMNKAKYESLTPGAKAAVDSHCTPEWAGRMMQAWQDWEGEARKMLAETGNTVYEITPEEQERWRRAAEDFQTTWAAETTTGDFDAASALADFKVRLSGAGAGY
jgi:TRAP-type C4-dicarboxylate transport system substrate-binding protein